MLHDIMLGIRLIQFNHKKVGLGTKNKSSILTLLDSVSSRRRIASLLRRVPSLLGVPPLLRWISTLLRVPALLRWITTLLRRISSLLRCIASLLRRILLRVSTSTWWKRLLDSVLGSIVLAPMAMLVIVVQVRIGMIRRILLSSCEEKVSQMH